MAHQHDLNEHWPQPHLVDYLRTAPPNGPLLSVLPRPRPPTKAPTGLAYLGWEDTIPRLAATRGIQIGYGGRAAAELPVLGEFAAADYAVEIAIGIAGGANWDGIKLLIRLAVHALRRQLPAEQQEDHKVEVRIGVARITDDGIDGLVVTASDPDEAGRQVERIIKTWDEVRSPGNDVDQDAE